MNASRIRNIRFERLEQRDVPGTLLTGSCAIRRVHAIEDQLVAINTQGKGQITSFNAATGQVTTFGEIDSGLLRGTTQFSAQITDARDDYVGRTLVNTEKGSIILTDTGTLHANGTFTDHATISAGTGQFKEAIGRLTFQGHELADGVHFLDDAITGSIRLRPSLPR
jgi:hypothetical protein